MPDLALLNAEKKNKEMKLDLYTDVIKAGLILPIKPVYTMRDVNNVITDSLFRHGGTLSEKEAVWVVKCSAVKHGTDWSKSITNWRERYTIG